MRLIVHGSVLRSTVTPSSRIVTFQAPFAAVHASNAGRPLMQHDIVNRDGGLAAVVHDPVMADGLRHPATVEVHVNAELGLDDWVSRVGTWCVARGKNRNPRFRAHTPLRPDDDPTAARKIHTRCIADYAPVHRDGLPAVPIDEALVRAVVYVDWRYALRCSGAGERAYADPLGAGAGGHDVPSDLDGDAAGGLRRTEVVGNDAVAAFSRRGDGMAAARPDREFTAVVDIFEISKDAVGIGPPSSRWSRPGGRCRCLPDFDAKHGCRRRRGPSW